MGDGDGGPYAGAQDLCSMGRNLCDVDGRLVHLALVNEVGGRGEEAQGPQGPGVR